MNFSPQARPVKLEGSPTYPYVRLQSIPVAHLVVDGRRKLLEPPQFNQPILVFSEPTAALFNQELTELSNFLALESMGFQPYFAYSPFLLVSHTSAPYTPPARHRGPALSAPGLSGFCGKD